MDRSRLAPSPSGSPPGASGGQPDSAPSPSAPPPGAPGEQPLAALPEEAQLPLPPAPGDPREELFATRLDFLHGDPLLPIRLMEGGTEVAVSSSGRVRLRLFGELERTVELAAGARFVVRLRGGEPAQVAAYVQLAEFRLGEQPALEAERALWVARGVPVRTQVVGGLYGIAGKIVDNRRYLLLARGPSAPGEARALQAELLRSHGARTRLFEQLLRPPRAILEVLDDEGVSLGLAQDLVEADPLEDAPFEVEQVEFGVGYDFHAFEDRSFRGALRLTADRAGRLAVINQVALEALLKGLVPSEIFARAHPEALKAQAVTARGEVLAKVGTKHLADPYLLCSEQHCAVYRGRSSEVPSTSDAVDETRGLALFSADQRLVDSVYSAVCGGHTEDNDVVWGSPEDPSLRGRPDLLLPDGALPTPAELQAYLRAELPAACRLSSFAQPTRYRWERRFRAEEVDAAVASSGIGRVRALAVTERGVSGRARLLTVSGEHGATQLRGELHIRRTFGMLNSAMFLVEPEHGADGSIQGWVFRGGGWGHGVGMCQTGAIGRAEAGHDFRAILRHYYNGAEVAPLY